MADSEEKEMKYAIMGPTVEQVKVAGGTDVREGRLTGTIYATLTGRQVAELKAMGYRVKRSFNQHP
ncbi:unnamed protein product [marine sediment metagenome]|uniref:Uncharacterized protein n=1 Tax=marine sediment metagenome TaxID=412755 RepID=X1PB88_9ZZZZ